MPKNLSGGKAHKKQGGKEHRSVKHNTEVSSEFVDDVMAGEKLPVELLVARATKCYGHGRFDVMDQNGEVSNATMRGIISCKGKAARAAGNPVAISADKFLLLQKEVYGSQIIAVFTDKQVSLIRDKIKAVKHFFTVSAGESTAEEGGFEFDYSGTAEEEVDGDVFKEKKSSSSATGVATAAAVADDDDLDIDAI